MRNFHLSATDADRPQHILIAVVAIVIGWQCLNSPLTLRAPTASAATPIATTPNISSVEPNIELAPESTEEKTIDELYQKSEFLAVIPTNERVSYSSEDLFCMAKNIYHEARNQSDLGQFAVAQVTINRSKHPLFTGGICDVVLAKNQFSWANNQQLRWYKPKNQYWDKAMDIAKAVLEEGHRVKGMHDVLYFHANYINPNWRNVERVARIDSHIFYRRSH